MSLVREGRTVSNLCGELLMIECLDVGRVLGFLAGPIGKTAVEMLNEGRLPSELVYGRHGDHTERLWCLGHEVVLVELLADLALLVGESELDACHIEEP